MVAKRGAPPAGTDGTPDRIAKGNDSSIARARIVVVIEVDTERRSPLQLRKYAREQYRQAVMRARAAGRIDIAVAEELIRAWPPAEVRK